MPSKHDPEQARSELDPGWTPVSRLREAQQRSRRFRCMLSAGEGRSHRPQVHFVKNASDAAACPAEHEGCEHPSYLVPGDRLVVGKSRGAFSCASYQSAADRRQNWTVGWLPSASLTPVQPARALRTADWIGRWIHAGGAITISGGRRGSLRIRGEHVYPATQNVHSGVIGANAKPAHGLIQFADDGGTSFDAASAEAGSCLVRMQRIAELLVVEDNGHCGGSLMTFTGFYRLSGGPQAFPLI